ncbi:MAG: thiamine phosphate synthase [bacterium]
MAISEESVCPEPIPDRVNRLIDLGVPSIQIRDKSISDRKRFHWFSEIRNERTTQLMMNSRIDLGILARADGIHRSQSAVSENTIRQIGKSDWIIGVSTHSDWEIHNAQVLGADYVTYGPVFTTNSHPERGRNEIPGVEGLKNVCNRFDIPILALGGVRTDNIEACLNAGADGVASIRTLFGHKNPESQWDTIHTTLNDWFGD